ncbi:MAG TPA: hypothetical protein VKU35_04545 [Candidatus Limnocylindria bacterium]|nr:hypothetical protein [Candidatus Limnocylindria bacterium]
MIRARTGAAALPPRRAVGLAISLAIVLAACGGNGAGATPGSSAATASVAIGPRPSSPAVVTIVEPKPNETVNGTTLHVVLSLEHAKIVNQTTTNIRPDEGHVHLYVNGVLVSMNYGLTQDLPVHPGTYALKAEFVASDHAPFNPRVWSAVVVFTVVAK